VWTVEANQGGEGRILDRTSKAKRASPRKKYKISPKITVWEQISRKATYREEQSDRRPLGELENYRRHSKIEAEKIKRPTRASPIQKSFYYQRRKSATEHKEV